MIGMQQPNSEGKLSMIIILSQEWIVSAYKIFLIKRLIERKLGFYASKLEKK